MITFTDKNGRAVNVYARATIDSDEARAEQSLLSILQKVPASEFNTPPAVFPTSGGMQR